MSLALPRVVRLGPLVGHLRDRRVIRSADKNACGRGTWSVACTDLGFSGSDVTIPFPTGVPSDAIYVSVVKSKFACLKDPDRPPWEQGKSADDFAAGFRGFVCPPDHRESPSGINLRF